MIVAAVAAVVAAVATAVAWRAGRRARRAADLVSQLLDPPVVEAPVVEPLREPVLNDVTGSLGALLDEPIGPPVSVRSTAPPDSFAASDGDDARDPVFVPAPPLRARPGPDDRAPSEGAGRSDPAPVRIPVLDLDRLRSWLTLGDVDLGRLAVVSVELDNLGFVQERLGYAAGAHLLEAITQRLRTVTRPRDVVAHVNRERFVLVCRDVPDRGRGRVAR